MITLACDLVLHAGASLRCAAASLALIVEHWHLSIPTPCFSTIRSWILRLGCYALCCPLPQGVPWMWLIDHTIQIGSVKLFVIMGCPLTQVPFGERNLCLADLRLIALVPMEHSTHERVDTELEKATARTGVPRMIASDHGSDVKKGIEDFQQRHPQTAHVHDVAHHGANVLEHRWERNLRWHEMLRLLSQNNQKMRQTADAYLLSPTLRPKARFMNVGPLLRFLRRVVRLLEQAEPHARVVERYGWLLEYRQDLAGWEEEHRVVQGTIEHVRRHGVNAHTVAELAKCWGELSARPGTQMVAGHMRAYARKYGRRAVAEETLVGSTEVLESSFGKLKRLEGDGSQGGFTGMVLALGAMTGAQGEEEVRKALDEVPKKEAEGWVKRTLGATFGWLRQQILADEKA